MDPRLPLRHAGALGTNAALAQIRSQPSYREGPVHNEVCFEDAPRAEGLRAAQGSARHAQMARLVL